MTMKTLLTIGALSLAVAGVASAQLEVVTNIPGGGPQGQPEDPACVKEGSYALRTSSPFGDDTSYLVELGATAGDGSPALNNETVVRQQFWFHPRGIVMDNGARHFVNVQLQAAAGQRPMQLILQYSSSTGYRMWAQCVRNCATPGTCSIQASKPRLALADDWNLLLLEWSHNSPAPAPADGICRVSLIDGPAAPQTSEKVDMRNSQVTVGRIRLGIQGGPLRNSTVGAHCFDDYQAFRTLAP